MLKKTINTIIVSFFLMPALKSQTGGDNIFEFLNLTYSAVNASLGGVNVSICNDDLNMACSNPALLRAEMSRNLTFNYVNYLAGINYGMTMYAMSFPRAGRFAAGLKYLNHGSFTEADEAGNITGAFSAAEYALPVIWSTDIDSLFSAGICFKPVLSHLEKYSSFGIVFDAGILWHSRNRLTSAGFVIRNAGIQVIPYAGEKREKLPFEIQAGISHRFAHAPLRFSLTLRHLEKFDLTHEYGSDNAAGEQNKQGFGENLLRHFIAGAEIIPHKNFYFSAGYNYRRSSELQVDSNVSTVGFSWGFGINTSTFSLGFGRATFHLAGASNHFTLTVRPDLLYKKIRN